MKIKMSLSKNLNNRLEKNEAAVRFSAIPTRILFEWFDGDESHIRIYTRMKRFIIRMKLYEQFLEYDRDIVKKVFNGK